MGTLLASGEWLQRSNAGKQEKSRLEPLAVGFSVVRIFSDEPRSPVSCPMSPGPWSPVSRPLFDPVSGRQPPPVWPRPLRPGPTRDSFWVPLSSTEPPSGQDETSPVPPSPSFPSAYSIPRPTAIYLRSRPTLRPSPRDLSSVPPLSTEPPRVNLGTRLCRPGSLCSMEFPLDLRLYNRSSRRPPFSPFHQTFPQSEPSAPPFSEQQHNFSPPRLYFLTPQHLFHHLPSLPHHNKLPPSDYHTPPPPKNCNLQPTRLLLSHAISSRPLPFPYSDFSPLHTKGPNIPLLETIGKHSLLSLPQAEA